MANEKICNFVSFILHEDDEPSNTRVSFVTNEIIYPAAIKKYNLEEDAPTSLSYDTLPKGSYYNYFTTINSWEDLENLWTDLEKEEFQIFHSGKHMKDFKDLKHTVIHDWKTK